MDSTKSGMKIKRESVAHCIECNRDYVIDKFYDSKATFLGKARVIPYCEDCCNDILQYYLKEKGSLESAVFYTCAKLDVPFIKSVFEASVKHKNNLISKSNDKKDTDYNIFKYYYMYLWGGKSLQKNTDVWCDFSNTDVSLDSINSAKKSEEAFKQDMEKFILDWGNQAIEDYQFLEYRYDVYTKDKVLTPAQETLYRSLCKAELRKRKKESKAEYENDSDIGDSVKEDNEMIMKLMDKLKISNFNEIKDKSDVELLIERQIWEHENTDPCEIVDKEYYKDYCDIGKNWGKQILRACRNILGGSREYPDINKDPKEW